MGNSRSTQLHQQFACLWKLLKHACFPFTKLNLGPFASLHSNLSKGTFKQTEMSFYATANIKQCFAQSQH